MNHYITIYIYVDGKRVKHALSLLAAQNLYQDLQAELAEHAHGRPEQVADRLNILAH
jgi:hypothetical protein